MDKVFSEQAQQRVDKRLFTKKNIGFRQENNIKINIHRTAL